MSENPDTTNDLRERVARALYAASNIAPQTYDETSQNRRDLFLRNADAAIHAVLSALAAEAEAYPEDDTNPFQWHHNGTLWEYDDYLNELVADWLRSHLLSTDTTHAED